jgi:hypothetical protein
MTAPRTPAEGLPAGPAEPAREPAATGARWPWDSPFAWAMPPQRRRKAGEAAYLARIRRAWTDVYDIPEPRKRWWQRYPELTARNKQTGAVLTARSADALERAVLEDYAAGLAVTARARAAAEEAAAAEQAAPQPVAVFDLPPDADCVSPASVTRVQLRIGGRPYLGDRDAS